MLRLYQRLQRWASLLHSPPSSLPVQSSIRRVVTVEWEERVVLLRRASLPPTPGDRASGEEYPATRKQQDFSGETYGEERNDTNE